MHDLFSSYKLICHNCGVTGHIQPNCAKLRNKQVNMTSKKQEKIVRPKIKSIWVRKSDLHAHDDMKYETLDDTMKSRDFGLAL